MTIITLDRQGFHDACCDLAAHITSAGFTPAMVIGIARGGDYVAETLCHHICPEPLRFSVTLQRPSTKAKSGLTTKILRHLPRPVCNLLRIAESRILAMTDRFRDTSLPDADLPVCLVDALADAAQTVGHTDLLIADDAVDSGKTLKAVRDAVEQAARQSGTEVRIKTAVITTTRRNPVLPPDFSHYPSGTIVRFPWAPDA